MLFESDKFYVCFFFLLLFVRGRFFTWATYHISGWWYTGWDRSSRFIFRICLLEIMLISYSFDLQKWMWLKMWNVNIKTVHLISFEDKPQIMWMDSPSLPSVYHDIQIGINTIILVNVMVNMWNMIATNHRI